MRIDLPNRQSFYWPDMGVVAEGTEVFCGLCGSQCDEHRNVTSARSYVESLSFSTSHHNCWACPNLAESWHKQAAELFKLAKATPSKNHENMLVAEANLIVENRVATKVV